MTNQLNVEAIVEEVVRRLLSQPEPQQAVASEDSQQSSTTEVIVEGRVITVDSLPACLENVTHLVVCVQAIVTPLVRDHLTDYGVQLVRRQLGAA